MSAPGPETWTAVDGYLNGTLLESDPALEAALQASTAAGLPAINVTPSQGKLLHLLARMQAARAILEIGTLGGYSTLWLARALPAGGKVVTLELERKCADVARANFARAGVAGRIELILGPAGESLPRLVAEQRGPFDLVFIDADKASTADYFAWALELARPGTLIVIDNVVRGGAIADPASTEGGVAGIRRALAAIAAEPRVTATALQTVGSKGYDGFALVLVQA